MYLDLKALSLGEGAQDERERVDWGFDSEAAGAEESSFQGSSSVDHPVIHRRLVDDTDDSLGLWGSVCSSCHGNGHLVSWG